jgi:Alpha/beta hydrolase family
MTKLNEFTVREQVAGGGVLNVVRRRGDEEEYQHAGSIVILIHGFNVSQERAGEVFGSFVERLQAKLMKVGGPPYSLPSVWAFYWPGDEIGYTRRAVTYSARIDRTERVGRLLCRLLVELERLNEREAKREVIFIGHSLGCRVLLHALACLSAEGRHGIACPKVRVAFLMAAAVPVGRCIGEGEPFRPAMVDDEIHAFFSRRDMVLRMAFPRGQSLFESTPSENTEAVGLHGGPPERWTPHRTKLGHKDYWKDDQSAIPIAQVLKPTVPSTKPGWYTPVRYPMLWDLPAPRNIEDRTLGQRLEAEWRDCWT